MAFATGAAYLRQEALPHIWCPGCGNGVVLSALVRAFEELGDAPEDIVVATGIGCWGKADDYLSVNTLHVTHGRALPFATGVKTANPHLRVVALMGDGDGATIGGNHLIHAARRNIDLTAIIVNNYNYGMTGGQFSATTPSGKLTKTSPLGNPERAFDLCALTAAAGANFVARETVRPGRGLTRILRSGLENKGFSLIEVVSPCTTLFGPRNGFAAPLDMLVWLQAHGVKRQTYERLDDPEATGHFATGVLVERHEPDFLSRYEAMRRLAAPLGRIIMKQYQIIIAGSGGQGIIVMGQMLARAALLEGRNAAQTQSYGIAQRGGFCAAEVITDEDEILFQQVERPDAVVVLGREAAERFACTPAPVIYDSDIIPFAGGGWIGLPLSTLATRAGNARASNAAGTGALVALTGMVRLESFLQALDGFKGAVREANI